MMEGIIYEEFDIIEINREQDVCVLKPVSKNVISEISLKIIVNDLELVSMLCLNQCHEELAMGFLYNEGVINSAQDIQNIYYHEKMLAVIVQLKEGILIDRQESLRSITSGCGKCYTYINPLKQKQYNPIINDEIYSIGGILNTMKDFVKQSEIFKNVGGVHSVLFHSQNLKILSEDIGRHNCFDKITGILLKTEKLYLTKNSMIFVSGRISSEIMTKIIRLGVPILVSRSTPTTAAVRLAMEYKVTLMGYVRENKGYIYTCSERLT